MVGCVALVVDDAPVGLDFDFQHLGVLGAGEGVQAQAAFRTLLCLKLNGFVVGGQVFLHGAAMTGNASAVANLISTQRRRYPTHLITN